MTNITKQNDMWLIINSEPLKINNLFELDNLISIAKELVSDVHNFDTSYDVEDGDDENGVVNYEVEYTDYEGFWLVKDKLSSLEKRFEKLKENIIHEIDAQFYKEISKMYEDRSNC